MRGDIREKALELLEPLYQAEFVDDGWAVFLRKLMGVMESDVAVVVSLDVQGRPLDLNSAGILTETLVADYQAHFAAVDPWPEAFLATQRPFGKNVCSQELLDPREFEQTEYYNDFWRPNHDLFHTCGTLMLLDHGFANVGFPRCRDRGSFDRSDITFLDILSPHIGAALGLHHRLECNHQIGAGAEAALEQMEDAMLIVEAHGRLIHANGVAEAELASGARLSIRDGILVAGRQTDQAAFDRALHAAAVVSEMATECAPLALATREAESWQRASISFYPLPRRACDSVASGRPCVLVVVCTGRSSGTPSASLLHELYGLTAMEARVVQGLSLGKSVEEIAVESRIGIGTARTHLKHAFLKTGTQRQSQLVALLNRIRARMRP